MKLEMNVEPTPGIWIDVNDKRFYIDDGFYRTTVLQDEAIFEWNYIDCDTDHVCCKDLRNCPTHKFRIEEQKEEMALLGKDPVNEYGADMRMLDLYLHDKDYTVSIEEGFDHHGVELRIQRYGKSNYHNKVMIGFEKIEQIDDFISMLQKAIGKEVEA